MERKPRAADAIILTWPLAIRLFIIGLVAALFSIFAYEWVTTDTGSSVAAQTMAMVMFSVLQIPIALGLRHPDQTVFRAETFSNRQLLLAYGWILLSLVLITEIGLFQKIFGTGPLTAQQWAVCLVASMVFLFVGEIFRLILRSTRMRSE